MQRTSNHFSEKSEFVVKVQWSTKCTVARVKKKSKSCCSKWKRKNENSKEKGEKNAKRI